MKNVKGVITVFMTFALVFLLTLMIVLLESVRIEGLKVMEEQAGNAAIESVLATYLKPLFKEYGLLAVDTGYGKEYVDEESLLDDFSYYYENNISSFSSLQVGNLFSVKGVIYEIEEMNLLTDNGGEGYIQSIIQYYPVEAAGDILQSIREDLVKVNQGEKAREETKTETKTGATKSEASSEIRFCRDETAASPEIRFCRDETAASPEIRFCRDETAASPEIRFCRDETAANPEIQFCKKETVVNPEEKKEESTTEADYDEKRYEEMIDDSPIGKAEEIEKKGWFALVLPKNAALSGYSFEKTDYPSEIFEEEVTFAESTEAALLKKVIFNEYVLNHFNSYTNRLHTNGVQYEVEYLLIGKESDDQNLKKTLEKIAWIREGLNLLYLLSDYERMEEAYLMAFSLASWTGNAILVEVTKLGLLASWAYAETILDLRSLVQGKTIPIMKSKETWSLNLSQVVSFLNGQTLTAKESKSGLSYKDYLRLLLFLADDTEIVYQSMDMIQERLCLQEERYRIYNSAYGLSVRADALSSPLFSGLNFIQNQFGKTASSYLLENSFRKEY